MREELWPHSIILASCKHGRKPGVSTRFAAGYNNGLQLYWLKIWIYAKYFICYFQGVYIITCNNLHCFKVPHFGKRGIFLYQSVWYFFNHWICCAWSFSPDVGINALYKSQSPKYQVVILTHHLHIDSSEEECNARHRSI